MGKRKIKRRRGEGISISGPATVHVTRGVTLVVEAPAEARVARLAKRGKAAAPAEGAARKPIAERSVAPGDS